MSKLDEHATPPMTTKPLTTNWTRPLACIVAVMSLVATTWTASVFILWCRIDDSVYFPAVEMGKNATFPPGHFEFGWVSSAATIVCATLTIVCGWYALFAKKKPIRSVIHAVVLLIAALLVGVAIPCIMRYAFLGFAPLIVGAGLLLLVALWPAPAITPTVAGDTPASQSPTRSQ